MNVQLAGLPMLPWSSPPLCYDTKAQHIMSTPVVVLKEVESVSTIISVLETTRHQGFPVTYEDSFTNPQGKQCTFGALRGLILRSQLKILLKEKAFYSSMTGISSRAPLSLETFRKYYPRYPAIQVRSMKPAFKSCYFNYFP